MDRPAPSCATTRCNTFFLANLIYQAVQSVITKQRQLLRQKPLNKPSLPSITGNASNYMPQNCGHWDIFLLMDSQIRASGTTRSQPAPHSTLAVTPQLRAALPQPCHRLSHLCPVDAPVDLADSHCQSAALQSCLRIGLPPISGGKMDDKHHD